MKRVKKLFRVGTFFAFLWIVLTVFSYVFQYFFDYKTSSYPYLVIDVVFYVDVSAIAALLLTKLLICLSGISYLLLKIEEFEKEEEEKKKQTFEFEEKQEK